MLKLAREKSSEESKPTEDMDAVHKEQVGPTEIYISKLYSIIAVLALFFIISICSFDIRGFS